MIRFQILERSEVRTLVMALVHAAGGRIHVTPTSAFAVTRLALSVVNGSREGGTTFSVNDMTAGVAPVIDGECTVVR